MNKIKVMVLSVALFFCAHITFSQEVAPVKTFEYAVGINHLKTQEQADLIVEKINEIKGIENCSLVLIEYTLVFQCTNHDMQKNTIMDVVKQIILEEGADITIINRKIITQNEENK